VAIIVKNCISAQEITLPTELQDANTTPLLISLFHQPDFVYVATLYSNPQTNINSSIPLIKHLEKYRNVVLIADLISQHPLMGDRKTDDNGGILFRYLLQSPFINVNVGPTRFMNNVESAPDRILLSPAIHKNLIYKLVQKSLTTDHGEIYLHFRLKLDKTQNVITRINYNKANWELYQQMIQRELENIDTPITNTDDITKVNDIIIQTL